MTSTLGPDQPSVGDPSTAPIPFTPVQPSPSTPEPVAPSGQAATVAPGGSTAVFALAGAPVAAGEPAVGGYPMPPTYDPTAVQQYSAPVVFGPYVNGAPMSGVPMPMSAMPMAMPMPEKPGRLLTITLIGLTTVLLLATGIMTTLFLSQRNEAEKANAQVASLSTQLNDSKAKAEQVQRELDNTKRDVTDAKQATEEMTNQKKALGDCLNAIYDYWAALDKSNGRETAAVTKAGNNLDNKCDEADKYL